MSSIYQKGRDGYYYYQTYVLNPETGKKDKRIFHSLGTRDLKEAESKRIHLDIQYENTKTKNRRLYFRILNKNKKILFMTILTSLITIAIYEYYNSYRNLDNILWQVESSIDKEKIIPTDNKSPLQTDSLVQNTISDQKTKISQIEIIPENESTLIVSPNDIKLPKYIIKRIEPLSDAFSQVKLFITVDETSNKSGLLSLCEKITQEYSEYSNILICLYVNTEVGHILAMGKDHNVSSEKQIDAWLAMYTYNPVEGAYFDDNPGGYLGLQ